MPSSCRGLGVSVGLRTCGLLRLFGRDSLRFTRTSDYPGLRPAAVLSLNLSEICCLRFFCCFSFLCAWLLWRCLVHRVFFSRFGELGLGAFGLEAQMNGAGACPRGDGKSFRSRGFGFCLFDQPPDLGDSTCSFVVVHRNRFRVSSIVAGAAIHRSPARRRGCSCLTAKLLYHSPVKDKALRPPTAGDDIPVSASPLGNPSKLLRITAHPQCPTVLSHTHQKESVRRLRDLVQIGPAVRAQFLDPDQSR